MIGWELNGEENMSGNRIGICELKMSRHGNDDHSLNQDV